MIEIIKHQKEWSEQLRLVKHLDIYHTYEYHQLSKSEDESPVLIKYTEGFTCILLPLLLRNIENSDYKDAKSVYGYVGILIFNLDIVFKKENFHIALNAFFMENKIVSVFSRLHPFLECQEKIIDGLGIINTLGKIVYIDLSDTLDDQKKMFNKRLRTYLNKSRNFCTAIKGDQETYLPVFINLYHENMRRVDADDSYFFKDSYFQQIMSSKEFDSDLMLCLHNETQEIIGGAIFLKSKNIVQYHLSGLNMDYNDLNPIKLIIDEMRIKSKDEGFKYFNLGGGRGSKEDSLFGFKSKFSKNFKYFKTWNYIVDEEAYKMLVKNHLRLREGANIEDTSFFPAYRSKLRVWNDLDF